MEDLRKENNKKIKTPLFKTKFFKYIIKNRWWILLFSLIFTLLFFPIQSGDFLGKTSHNFFTNLIKYYK
jgi:hypothetical protein